MKKLKKISIVMLLVFAFTIVSNPIVSVLASESKSKVETSTNEEYKEGQVYHGFKLQDQEKISGYNATGRLFIHEKSGAQVFQFKNSDSNKFFAISFKTPTDNDKGTPHIFEHALLMGGSEKYPVKQLLNYIMNGSLCNMVNGFTMQDTTVYPFSTIHEEEFKNVMDVYLDMAYNAQIKTSENIFKEEAWHYELESLEDELEYKGVVLSEMKGNASNSLRKLMLSINRSLFPDTTYNYNSGGDPKHIPELTYKEVVDFYDKYYTPSNSFIFIYGDTTIDDKLEHIDSEYLKDVKKKDKKVEIKTQKSYTKQKDYIEEYGIAEGQPVENMDYLAINYVLGDSTDLETMYTVALLNMMVMENKNSVFQQKMMEAGFNNVMALPSFQQAQSTFSIVALNSDRNKKDLFQKTVNEALNAVIKEGIDEELLQSTINNYYLQDRLSKAYTSDTALSIFTVAHLGYTYDSDIINMFNGEEAVLEKMKNANKDKLFEKFIENKLLKNNFRSFVTLKAVSGLNEKEVQEEVAKLKKYKDSLTKEQKEALIKENQELLAWQNTLESPEVLSKIPMVDISTLEPEVNVAKAEVKRSSGVKVLHYPLNTNGANNIKLSFSTKSIPQEQIPYITLLATVIGGLDTENYTNEEILKEALKYTNGISVNPMAILGDHRNTYEPMMQVNTTFLNENMDEALALVKELILNVNFEDKEKLRTVIAQAKAMMDMSFDQRILQYAQIANLKRSSDCFAYNDYLSGLEFYKFITDLNANFDAKYDEIINNLKSVYETIFNVSNLTVNLTAEEKVYEGFEASLKGFIKDIPNEVQKIEHYKFEVEDKNTAYVAQSQVNYNMLSFNSKELGFNLDASNNVVNSIVNDFLYYTHRVQGKAYGSFLNTTDNGDFIIMTYRDPRVGASYDDLNLLVDYLRNPANYEAMLNQYKLNALKQFYYPKSVYDMANEAQSMYYRGISDVDLIKELDSILNVTVEDIKAYADLFEIGLKNAKITTIGNKELIEASKDKFEVIKNIFE